MKTFDEINNTDYPEFFESYFKNEHDPKFLDFDKKVKEWAKSQIPDSKSANDYFYNACYDYASEYISSIELFHDFKKRLPKNEIELSRFLIWFNIYDTVTNDHNLLKNLDKAYKREHQ